MSKKVKLILNCVTVAIFIVAFVSFFLDWIFAYVQGAGVQGSYQGYQLALNFDGFPQNLGALFPLLLVVGILIYLVIAIISKIKNLKKPVEEKSGMTRPVLSALFFVLCPLIALFLCLASLNIVSLPPAKHYGGYYLGIGAYLTAYCTLIGGLMLFITESGIFKDK